MQTEQILLKTAVWIPVWFDGDAVCCNRDFNRLLEVQQKRYSGIKNTAAGSLHFVTCGCIFDYSIHFSVSLLSLYNGSFSVFSFYTELCLPLYSMSQSCIDNASRFNRFSVYSMDSFKLLTSKSDFNTKPVSLYFRSNLPVHFPDEAFWIWKAQVR